MRFLFLTYVFYLLNYDTKADINVEFIAKYQENYTLPGFFTGFDSNSSLRIHYDGIQKTYTQDMNEILAEWKKDGNKTIAKAPLLKISQQIETVDEKLGKPLKRAVGGFINHLFYFATFSMGDDRRNKIPEEVVTMMSRSFVSMSQFEQTFATEVQRFYGVGFVWLCRMPGKKSLSIFPTLEDNTPLSSGFQPLLGIDLWEHAYYNKFENNRDEYFKSWWQHIDWNKVNEIYKWWVSMDS